MWSKKWIVSYGFLYFIVLTARHYFLGSKDGAVVRALASSSMWLGFDSGLALYVGWVCCWFSPCSEGFSLGFSGFSPPPPPQNKYFQIPIRPVQKTHMKTSKSWCFSLKILLFSGMTHIEQLGSINRRSLLWSLFVFPSYAIGKWYFSLTKPDLRRLSSFAMFKWRTTWIGLKRFLIILCRNCFPITEVRWKITKIKELIC